MFNSSPQRCVELMTRYLNEEQDERKTDFILLPEGAISYIGELQSVPTELECLSQFAARYQLILICGTVTETARETETEAMAARETDAVTRETGRETIGGDIKCYTTCVIFDQEGKMILKYRKRDTMGMMSDGTEVGVCDTIHGRIGVLICYDAERPALIEDTLASSPSLIFNPAHLSSFQGIPQSLRHSSWRVALDTSSRYFEYLSHSTGVTFVRCDQPHSANTFLTTPTQTIFIPSLTEQALSVLVPSPRLSCPCFPSPEHQLSLPSEFGRIRTEKMDNTGLRVTIQTVPRTRKRHQRASVSDQNEILRVQIVVPRGRPKGRILILSRFALEIWDPVDSSLYYLYDLRLSPDPSENGSEASSIAHFTDCLIDGDGVIHATDTFQRLYKWMPTSQSYDVLVTSDGQGLESVIESPLGVSTEQSPSRFLVSDGQQRDWMVSLDHRTDLQCSNSSEHYLNPSLCCSSLGFHLLLNEHEMSLLSTPLPLPLYRVLLPVSCHSSSLSREGPSVTLHYDQRVGYLPLVTTSGIHLLQFFHNRVPVKIIDLLSVVGSAEKSCAADSR
jgi:predicted amidohydrolase